MDLSEPVTMPVVAKAISWGNAERLTVSSPVLAALPKKCTQYRNTAKTDKLTFLFPTDAGMENLQVERLRARNSLGWRPVVRRIGSVRPTRPGPFADSRGAGRYKGAGPHAGSNGVTGGWVLNKKPGPCDPG